MDILYPKFRIKLLAMMKEDQKLLRQPKRNYRFETSSAKKHTAQMKNIIRKVGWPDWSKVGEDGAKAAWLLAQHSDRDLQFQRKCLKLIKMAVKLGKASKTDLAYLIDRVKVNSGTPQLYGTQFYKYQGRFRPRPISHRENLDSRRKKMGLELFSRYQKHLEQLQLKKK